MACLKYEPKRIHHLTAGVGAAKPIPVNSTAGKTKEGRGWILCEVRAIDWRWTRFNWLLCQRRRFLRASDIRRKPGFRRHTSSHPCTNASHNRCQRFIRLPSRAFCGACSLRAYVFARQCLQFRRSFQKALAAQGCRQCHPKILLWQSSIRISSLRSRRRFAESANSHRRIGRESTVPLRSCDQRSPRRRSQAQM